MNDGSYMMLPNKDGTMVRVPRESRNLVSFKKKENGVILNYIDVGIANYVVLIPEQVIPPKQEEEKYFQGFQKMVFDVFFF